MFGLFTKNIMSSELREALIDGKMDVVREIVSKNPKLAKSIDDNDSTPLHYVALNRSIKYFTDLDAAFHDEKIVYWSNTDLSKMREKTPLHLAVLQQDEDKVKLLVSKYVDLNVQDQDGQTPLHIAAKLGNEGIIRILAGAGADSLIINNQNRTPSAEASEAGKGGLVAFLMDLEAEESKRRKLDTAIENNMVFVGTTKFLLAMGADPNARNKSHTTPFHMACGDGQTEIAETLINEGAEVQARTKSGKTPLHLAATNGHVKIVNMLLEIGANPNVEDDVMATPLHAASARGNIRIVESLIEHGADVNAKDLEGATPLISATNEGFENVADLLRNSGGME